MANRFINTDIWKKRWFRELQSKNKLFLIYLITNCDHTGLYDVDIRTAEYFLGESINASIEMFGDHFKIIELNKDTWFLVEFLKLQYPKGLNSRKSAIVSVKTKILEHGLHNIVRERFGNDYLIIKEEDKEKDIDQRVDKDKTIEKDKVEIEILNDFEEEEITNTEKNEVDINDVLSDSADTYDKILADSGKDRSTVKIEVPSIKDALQTNNRLNNN